MRRALMLAAALAIPFSGASAVALSSPAWAATTITCTAVGGFLAVTGDVMASSCTDPATGGASQAFSFTVLASGGMVTWTSGTTTTLGAPTTKSSVGKKCPGYVKGATSNPTLVSFKGKVTADSGDGIKVPGKYSGEVCVRNSGKDAVSALKPLKIS